MHGNVVVSNSSLNRNVFREINKLGVYSLVTVVKVRLIKKVARK